MSSTTGVPSAVPIWSLKLRHNIRQGLVTLGRYDGVHPSLTCATDGGKVFIHDMQVRQKRLGGADSGQEYQLLDMHTQVTSLLASNLKSHSPAAASERSSAKQAGDILFVGSDSYLKAYNVYSNSELFYRDVLDGVNCMAVGSIGDDDEPLIFAGGNCSVLGLDMEGADKYWTVTGDNVQALAMVDFDGDGKNELLVGSDDYDVRVFKGDEMMCEIGEVGAVLELCPLQKNYFVFSLANGSVGCYAGSKRLWRIKSRNYPTSILAFDYDQDGVQEVLSGWSKGKVDVRRCRSGVLMTRTFLPSGIAGLVIGDYNQEGMDEIMCCCLDGTVKGYSPQGPAAPRSVVQLAKDQEFEITTLRQARKTLMDQLDMEMANIKVAGKLKTTTPASGVIAGDDKKLATIHVKTNVECGMELREQEDGQPHIVLSVEVTGPRSENTLIKSVVVFAEGLFNNESHYVYLPDKSMKKTVNIPIFPDKDLPIDVLVKVLVGTTFSEQFHVFELKKQLPRFSMILPLIEDRINVPTSMVRFHHEPIKSRHVCQWLVEEFLVVHSSWREENVNHIRMKSIRHGGQSLTLELHGEGQVYMYTNEIQLAGDLIQSLATYLNIKDLNVECYFPAYEEYILKLVEKVEEQQMLFNRLRAEIADHSNLIRGLVVRAEDARINYDMTGVRQAYKSLHEFNLDLVRGHTIRCGTHDQLIEMQRQLNLAVQQYGRLRVGKSKSTVVAEARDFLQSSEKARLLEVLRGHLDEEKYLSEERDRRGHA